MTTASCTLKPKCVVGLFSSQLLAGTLFGLKLHQGTVELDERVFHCCAGTGILYQEELRGVTRCSIRSRIRNVASIYHQYWEANGKDITAQDLRLFNAQYNAALIADVEALTKGTNTAVYLSASKEQSAHNATNHLLFWGRCFAVAWRAGASIKIVSLARFKAEDLVLRDDQLKVLAVTGLHKLTDPAAAEAFEALISMAYHGQMGLLIDGHSANWEAKAQQTQSPVAGFGTKGIFKQRAEVLKRRHPLLFVQRDCLSRLEDMLGGRGSLRLEGIHETT